MSTPVEQSTTIGDVEYSVTPGELLAAANSTNTTAQELDAQLSALKTYVIGLEEAWHGMAANEFQDLMVQWDTYARMLNDALTSIAGGLQGNYGNYDVSEQRNLTNLSSVRANIPSANFS
ncbi:WXG100 family type VII secretion target [Streptomyces liangshanensis]|uniref:WXG100 family type VII secretion target n=1 Tax=Streptomyces liangshanensis TaxID=2717324 RepID=A0A6G9GZ07_9ACTN|nr:WXG100 family type VII secretion target [Streptomyces liangshanensis]QIQ03508.1 WXG100 family type VII secretion target [Streptomyces liangshanensis]